MIKIQARLQTSGNDAMLYVTVADNGPGISEEDQRKLFKPFSKLKEHKNLNPNGNGLGLNICKLICKKLGGDIKVTSRPGDWTQFTFWVKVKPSFDCDIYDAISPRPIMRVRDLPDGHTKSALTANRVINQNVGFGAFLKGKQLSIVCADDVYYNLETLKIVFQRMGLSDYCNFVTTGQEVVDCCAKNLYELEEG